jgi:hypothetical protein
MVAESLCCKDHELPRWRIIHVENGESASAMTTHGDTEVAKLLLREEPSGYISQRCTSRADQSFISE